MERIYYSYTERFQMWFARPFEALRRGGENWNGAYVAMSMGLFLCERYYRVHTHTQEYMSDRRARQVGRPGYNDEFKAAAATALNISLNDFKDFWSVFRNGIQHQGMPRTKIHKHDNGDIIKTLKHSISASFTAIPVQRQRGEITVIEIDPWKFTELMIHNFTQNPLYLEVGFQHAFSDVFSSNS